MLLNKTNQSQMYYHARKAPIIVEKDYSQHVFRLIGRKRKRRYCCASLPFTGKL